MLYFHKSFKRQKRNRVHFNHNSIQQVLSQKHLGMYDTKLNFQEQLNKVLKNLNKTIRLLRELQAFLQVIFSYCM